MKKLAVCLSLAVFTAVSAVQAADGCCAGSKSADTKDAQATCPFAKAEKAGCCAKAEAQAKAKAKLSFDSSVKGATQLVKK
jgi:hypothetical protein